MISSNAYLALLRKSRKNKRQLEASHEMVNAFDKISLSVRRAHNVNRCRQDHLDTTLSTLENEHRKSMGLLQLEQRRFIRARKSSNMPFKPGKKHRMAPRNLPNFNVSTPIDGIVKTPFPLLSLPNICRLKDDESVEVFKRKVLNRNEFNVISKTQCSKRIHLPSMYRENRKFKQGLADKWLDGRKDIIHKQQYVASWSVSDSIKSSKETGKSYKNLMKSSLRLNCESCLDGTAYPKQNVHAYYDINHSMLADITQTGVTKNSLSLSQKKIPLRFHSSPDTAGEREAILDKTTEIRLKQFLKLPSIGGIHEVQSPEQSHDDTRTEVQESSSQGKKPSKESNSLDPRRKSSLWKNLVDCRYLRLGEEHTNEQNITSNNCACNWCSLMRKLR